MILDINDSCNNNCIFCSVSKSNTPRPSTHYIISLLKSEYYNGEREVYFQGGEPLLRKDIFKILSYSSRLGYKIISIVTNGRIISNLGFLKSLIKAGLNHIFLFKPLDESHDSELSNAEFDKITNVEGSYEQLKLGEQNLILLKSQGFDISYDCIFPKDEAIHKCCIANKDVAEVSLLGLGNMCNQKCVFCTLDKYLKIEIKDFESKPTHYLPDKSREVSFNEISKKIDDSFVQEIIFGWPEPTLRPDLPELLAYAKGRGIKTVTINTNGANLSDKDYLQSLVDAGLNRIILSLHSHISQTSEELSQTSGHYKKTIQGLRNSLDLNVRVCLVHVINSYNYRDLLNFVKFVKTDYSDVEQIDFIFIKPNDSDPEKVRHLVPRLSDVKPYLKDALDYCTANDIVFHLINIPPCFTTGFEHNNSQFIELSRIDSDNPFSDWMKRRRDNRELDEYGYKGDQCSQCKYDKLCVGYLREYAALYGYGEMRPV